MKSENCSICLEALDNPEKPIMTLPCKYIFHTECGLTKWVVIWSTAKEGDKK